MKSTKQPAHSITSTKTYPIVSISPATMSTAYTDIDHNPATVQITYGGEQLYQRHSNGQIWKFNGERASPRWSMLSGNDSQAMAIAASPKDLFKLRKNGELLRYNKSSGKFETIKQLRNVKDVIASEKMFYYVLAGDGASGIAEADVYDPSPSYGELRKLYDELQEKMVQVQAENSRLQGIKEADGKIIAQLQSDYDGAQAQVAILTAQLQQARDDAAKQEKELQGKITKLQKDLLAAEQVEAKLVNDLDEEKKKEHEEWKKFQEHDAQDHRVIEQAHKDLAAAKEHAVELQKAIDALTKEAAALKATIKKLEAALAEAQRKEQLAEAELKKHLNDDVSGEIVISGLEKVIQGLKKELEGQQELIDVMRKQLHQ